MQPTPRRAGREAQFHGIRFALYGLGAVLWMCLLWFLSGMHGSELPGGSFSRNFMSPLVHIFEYGFLGALLASASSATGSWVRVIRWWMLFIGFWYAGLDEVHQSFVPGREMSIVDILVDWVSLGAGWIVFTPCHRKP